MKIVLDTNIIVSAFATRGICKEIFESCLIEYQIILSKHILRETARVLKQKFKVPAEKTKEIVLFLENQALIVSSPKLSQSISRDSQDDYILSTAIQAKAEIIIAGDKDLLVLKKVGGVKIFSPKEFWKYFPPRR